MAPTCIWKTAVPTPNQYNVPGPQAAAGVDLRALCNNSAESLQHVNPCTRGTQLVVSETLTEQMQPEILSTLGLPKLWFSLTHTHTTSLPIFFLGKTKKPFIPDRAQVSLDQHTDSVAWHHELCSCQRQVTLKIQLIAYSGRKSSRAKSELGVIWDRYPQRKQKLHLE